MPVSTTSEFRTGKIMVHRKRPLVLGFRLSFFSSLVLAMKRCRTLEGVRSKLSHPDKKKKRRKRSLGTVVDQGTCVRRRH